MTRVRRPILVLANLLLILIGSGLAAGGIAIRHSSNPVLLNHPPMKDVEAQVQQITDVKKLQAMAVSQYRYLDSLAMIIEGGRDLAIAAGVIVAIFGSVNFALIPWRLRKREPLA